MMTIPRILFLLTLFLLILPATLNAQNQKIIFTKTQYLDSDVKTVSIYVKLQGSDAENLKSMTTGVKRRSYIKIWDNLFLNIISEAYTGVTEKPFAFYLSFTSDEEGKRFLHPLDQPSHGPSADLIRASDINEAARHAEESGNHYFDITNKWNLTESREIAYDNFRAIIRILEFESTPTKMQEVDAFENLSLIIVIKEKKTAVNTRLDLIGGKPGAVLH